MPTPIANDPVATLAFFLIVFLVVGVFFLFIHLVMGSVIRPNVPDPEKLTIYECGEPTVGSAWVQFDLRYYVVALLFVIFDVEVAFFFPWALVFGKANQLADENIPIETRERLSADLLPSGMAKKTNNTFGLTEPGEIVAGKGGIREEQIKVRPITAESAKGWARVAFFDILVFFGVLMVGFAYVWRRGDLNWVRAVSHVGGSQTAAQQPPQAA